MIHAEAAARLTAERAEAAARHSEAASTSDATAASRVSWLGCGASIN